MTSIGLKQLVVANIALTANSPVTISLRTGLKQACDALTQLLDAEIQQQQLKKTSDPTKQQAIEALQAKSAKLKYISGLLNADQIQTPDAVKFTDDTIQDIGQQAMTIENQKNALRSMAAPRYSDEFTLPDAFEARVQPDGSIYVGLDGWKYAGDTSEAAADYSTAAGNIRNVVYEEHGGVFSFDVRVGNSLIYNIKISRNHYELIDSGFISFYGDIIVKDQQGNELRYGVAKFYGRK